MWSKEKENQYIRKGIIYLSAILIWCILSISTLCTNNDQHEAAHHAVFNQFNVNSTVELYGYGLLGGVTIPHITEGNANLTNEDYKELRELNLNVDAVGYQLLPILCTLLLLLLAVMLIGAHKLVN